MITYLPQKTWVDSLNPVTKLTYVLCTVLLVIVTPGFVPLLGLWVAGLLAMVAARVLIRGLSLLQRTVLPVALFLFLIQGLFYPGAQQVVLALGPLSLKAEGLEYAAMVSLRLAAVVTSFALFLLTTHPNRLMTSLEQRGFSSKVSYIVLATIQLIPMMQQRAAAIFDAQRSRGLEIEGSLVTRFRALLAMIGPLVMGSVINVETRSMALEARAFLSERKRTHLFEVPDRPVDTRVRLFLAIGTCMMVAWRLARW